MDFLLQALEILSGNAGLSMCGKDASPEWFMKYGKIAQTSRGALCTKVRDPGTAPRDTDRWVKCMRVFGRRQSKEFMMASEGGNFALRW